MSELLKRVALATCGHEKCRALELCCSPQAVPGECSARARRALDASGHAAMVEALELIRDGLRNLPASATAVKLDEIASAALKTARGE